MGDSDARPRLPDVALPPAAGGAPVPLRVARHAAVLVLLDAPPDAEGFAFLHALADADATVQGWDGRALVVVAGDVDATAATLAAHSLPWPVLADAPGVVSRAANVTPPALLVADQWGEVHAAAAVRPGTAWMTIAKLEQWLRWLAIRCAG